MRKKHALDLFCCAGGATRGLQLAGYAVTGVDIEEHPNYIGEKFIQVDALSLQNSFASSTLCGPRRRASNSVRTAARTRLRLEQAI